MVKTFKCYGGPLDGQHVKESEAEDYIRFNSSVGELFPTYKIKTKRNIFCIGTISARKRKIKIEPYCPSSILVWMPDVPDVIINEE